MIAQTLLKGVLVGSLIDFGPLSAAWVGTISTIGKDDPGTCDGDALPNEELRDDVEAGHSKASL
jgi:hypothetical protein